MNAYFIDYQYINIQINNVYYYFLINLLIRGAPEAQYRRCEAAVKSGNKRGGYTVASSKTRGETPTRSNFLP